MLWNKWRHAPAVVLCCLCMNGVLQGAEPQPMKEDKTHIQVWNQYMEDVLALFRRLQQEGSLTRTSKLGGYASQPDYYVEHEYRDAQGRLIARLQWEREHPDRLHAIEVYRYDGQGRVIRDYAGAYLPHYRNAPTQTLVSLHAYNGELHAFRTFDASAEFIFERCEGRHRGKEVFISLDFDEKDALEGRPNTVLTSKAYQACFKGLSGSAGQYLQPQ